MSEDIIFVTAYRDIGRSNWNVIPRTNETYCNNFYKYASRIKYNLVVFIEEKIKSYLLDNYNFNSNIIFYDIDLTDTFFKKYLNTENSIINSIIYKKKIPEHRNGAPEHLYAEYNLVNHSKINYVRKAKELFNGYKFYTWIDFGIRLPENSTVYNSINLKNIPKKIIYQNLGLFLPEKNVETEPDMMLSSHTIYFAGSIFIVHADLVLTYELLYENKLRELQEKYIVDDDQNVVLQLYLDNKDIFFMPSVTKFPELNIPIGTNEWFKLYEFFAN